MREGEEEERRENKNTENQKDLIGREWKEEFPARKDSVYIYALPPI